MNDLLLHALFARLALSNNDTIEFETFYDRNTNTIELDIPNEALPFLDQITGMKRGPRFQEYINWLIGSQSLQHSYLDGDFVPSTSLESWFGGTRSVINEKMVLLLPDTDVSVVGYNLKTNDTFSGRILISLIWMYTCGVNTTFDIRTTAHVATATGDTPVLYVDDTNISTLNLIEGDVRETQLLEVTSVGSNNIVHILLNRNYQGSPDPQTESVGIVGLRVQLLSQ